MLVVYTARVTYAVRDRLDVTRKSADSDGMAFAPSWTILRPVLTKRRDSYVSDGDWHAYVEAYTCEMRVSYRDQRTAWDALLARPEVTLVCYCTDPARCHRTVLSGILAKLGADVRGERDLGERR